MPLPARRRILGIDFSGARDAGKKIWIAEAHQSLHQREHPLTIEDCRPALNLPRSGAAPAFAIPALIAHILRDPTTIAGCDFPFSLPAVLMQADSWDAFIAAFPARFADPEAYRAACQRLAEGHELKRRTDKTASTPFSSYNLRLYRQAWWGMAHFLSPLITSNQAVVAPQMPFAADKATVIEICPASSLQYLRCRSPYKGRAPAQRRAREMILTMLIERGLLAPPTAALSKLLLDNNGGDALDAVIAAIATAQADLTTKSDAVDRLEGRVYFEIKQTSRTKIRRAGGTDRSRQL